MENHKNEQKLIEQARVYLEEKARKISYLAKLAEYPEFACFSENFTTEEEAKNFLIERGLIKKSIFFMVNYLSIVRDEERKEEKTKGTTTVYETMKLTKNKEPFILKFPIKLQSLGTICRYRKFKEDGTGVECFSNNLITSARDGRICKECEFYKSTPKKCKKMFDMVCYMEGEIAIFSLSGKWGYDVLSQGAGTEKFIFEILSSRTTTTGSTKTRFIEFGNCEDHNFDPQNWILSAIRMQRNDLYQ